MGGQSSGYQSQPMNQGGGGQRFGGGGFGGGFGGYGNGGYMPQSFNQQGYGGIQGGGGGQGGGGSFSGGNMAWRDPNSPLYNWDQTHAGGQQGGFGQQSSQNYGGSGGSQQPMSYDAYMQAHAGQPIQSSDYGNYVQGFNQSQNQQPFTGRGGGTYTPGMNLFGNGGGNQYGNPFSQFMPQSFNQQGYGQPQGFGWNNNFSNGFGGWNQFGGWPQFNGFQSGWQPQYQQPQSQQPQFSPASQDMNQDMVPTRAQGMVRLPPINYDQYQKQPNQYEYLNGGNSPFSQVA